GTHQDVAARSSAPSEQLNPSLAPRVGPSRGCVRPGPQEDPGSAPNDITSSWPKDIVQINATFAAMRCYNLGSARSLSPPDERRSVSFPPRARGGGDHARELTRCPLASSRAWDGRSAWPTMDRCSRWVSESKPRQRSVSR